MNKIAQKLIIPIVAGAAMVAQGQVPAPIFNLNGTNGTGAGTPAVTVPYITAPASSTAWVDLRGTSTNFTFTNGVDGSATSAIYCNATKREENEILAGALGPAGVLTNFSMTMWMNVPSALNVNANNQRLYQIGKGAPPSTGAGDGDLVYFAWNGTGGIQFHVNGVSANNDDISPGGSSWAGSSLDKDTWYFVAVTYDLDHFQSYLYTGETNIPVGNYFSFGTAGRTPLYLTNATTVTAFNRPGGTRCFSGMMDKMKIYPVALSAGQAEMIRYLDVNPSAVDPYVVASVMPGTIVFANTPLIFTATANPNGGAVTYQWQTDGGTGTFTNIPNATGAALTNALPDLGYQYTVQYQVIATNPQGQETSAPLSITINPSVAPAVLQDTAPANVVAYLGGSATFTASFGGSVPMTNFWQVNKGTGFTNLGTAIVSVSNVVTLTLTNLKLTDAGSYQLLARNPIGSATSTPATLTVIPTPALPDSTQTYAYEIYTNGPVGYWRLNDTAYDPSAVSAPAFDSSGHNYSGIYQSGVTVNNPGPQAPTFPGLEATNICASFPGGANGAIQLPSLYPRMNTNTVTIAAWINPNGTVPANSGIFFYRSSTEACGLCFTSALDDGYNRELGYNWNNNAATYNFHSGLFPPANIWSLVVLRISPTKADMYLMYADPGYGTNVLAVQNPIANSPGAFTNSVLIGGDGTDNGRRFTGLIDEVAVFNKDLTDSQIVDLFVVGCNAHTAPTVNITSLSSIACYPNQPVPIYAAGGGAPFPSFQWQAGPSGSGTFTNLPEGSHFTGTTTPSLNIQTTLADSLDYRVVVANSLGSATSGVATLSLTPTPNNGLWSVNFAVVATWTLAPQAPSTPYVGKGIVGNGTYWNKFLPDATFSLPGYADDGVTPSGIRMRVVSSGDNWFGGYPMHNALLAPYCQNITGVVFTNVPDGTYNLAVYSANGLSHSGGATFSVQGNTQVIANTQDTFFAPNDNSYLFPNVYASGGALSVDVSGAGFFNGAQLQAVSLSSQPILQTSKVGKNLSLSWAGYGVLMSATNVLGPWVAVPAATSPYLVNPTNRAGFYRVLVH